MSEGSPFWIFSLRTYSRPGVSEACLELQERSGVDVNVLLFLLWLAAQGRRADCNEVAAIIAAVEDWRREVVTPLRRARRAAKEAPEGFDAHSAAALRTLLKRVELEAERLEQEALYAWRPAEKIGTKAPPPAAALAHMELYAETLGAAFPATPQTCVVAAALSYPFPEGGGT
jgi:uncharacterized protein (TIGR02444 family)